MYWYGYLSFISYLPQKEFGGIHHFFFIIMTFEEMSTFLTCSEQLDQIKLNLLERFPTVAISTFFENKL